MTAQVLVIDPALRIAETECYNAISLTTSLKTTYHLPAMYGLQSLKAIDMSTVRGMIILGSASSVHDRTPWQAPFENWLMTELTKKIPTLGLCYGHQMLAYIFGGSVGYVYPDQKKNSGSRQIKLSDLNWMAGESGKVIVSHNEMVTKLPTSFSLIAESPECATDGMRHNELPIWSLQSHPEATLEFLKNHDIDVDTHGKHLTFGRKIVQNFLSYIEKRA